MRIYMKIITLGTSHGDPTASRYNSSTLLECNGAFYLLDAGAPVAASLIRRGIDISSLRGIFLTHMHEDHFGGLSGLLKHLTKYPPSSPVPVYLPEDAGEAFKSLLAVSHRPLSDEAATFKLLKKGLVYEDGNLTIEAIPTRHAENEGRNFPSFGFSIHSKSGKHYLHTGDLKHDFSDFPGEYCTPDTVCVCELTHYPWSCAEPVLKNIKLTRMIFSHIGNQWKSGTVFDLPYDNIIAEDGDEFKL